MACCVTGDAMERSEMSRRRGSVSSDGGDSIGSCHEVATKRTKKEPGKVITFVCPYPSCRKVSTKRRDHQRHMSAVHNEGVVWFCCRTDGCGFHAKRRDYFQRHIKQTNHNHTPLILEEERFNRMIQSLFDNIRYKARLRQDEERWRAYKMPYTAPREARWRYFQNVHRHGGASSSVSGSVPGAHETDPHHRSTPSLHTLKDFKRHQGGASFEMEPQRGAFLMTDTPSFRSVTFPMPAERRHFRPESIQGGAVVDFGGPCGLGADPFLNDRRRESLHAASPFASMHPLPTDLAAETARRGRSLRASSYSSMAQGHLAHPVATDVASENGHRERSLQASSYSGMAQGRLAHPVPSDVASENGHTGGTVQQPCSFASIAKGLLPETERVNMRCDGYHVCSSSVNGHLADTHTHTHTK